jgi:predicted RNase H-like HicB family nuclease
MSYRNHFIYPVVAEKGADGGIGMYFPDFPGTAILGKDLIDGIKCAKEMLANLILECEEKNLELPQPSTPEKIKLFDVNDRIVFIEIYMPPYRDENANKSVTKNCTLPKWLRDAGEEAGLNFSQLLQTSIKEALGIEKRPKAGGRSIQWWQGFMRFFGVDRVVFCGKIKRCSKMMVLTLDMTGFIRGALKKL